MTSQPILTSILQEEYDEGSDEKMSESSSNSDSEDDNEEELERISKTVAQLKVKISENCQYYDGHTDLIAALRKLGELEQLRSVRNNMNKVFPLTPELWLDWVKDEQKICTSEEERNYVNNLFDRAVKDYMSVQLWVEYIMFSMGGDNMKKTRDVCDRALMHVGTHVAEGILVWQAVLLFEQQVYATLQAADVGSSQGTEEKEKNKVNQLQRIRALMRRQVRVPLLNTDKDSLLEEAITWFEGKVETQMKNDLEKNIKKMQLLAPFEDSLLQAKTDPAKLTAYYVYLDHLKKESNPTSIQSLYERAVTDFAVEPGLWEEYVSYVMQQFGSADYVILPVCERSIRNCPWSGNLIELYIIALQVCQHAIPSEGLHPRIKAVLDIGLASGVQVGSEVLKMWMAYLVFMRRGITLDKDLSNNEQFTSFRQVCTEAMTSMDSHCGETGDLECNIGRFVAHVEAELGNNMQAARDIWNNNILQRNNHFNNAQMWLEFINLERSYGTVKHCRKLFRRALERVWDWVELVAVAFKKFEQQVGTSESMIEFNTRLKGRMAIVAKRRSEDAVKEDTNKMSSEPKVRDSKLKDKGQKYTKKTGGRNHKKCGDEKVQRQESQVFKIPHPVGHQSTNTNKSASALNGGVSSTSNRHTEIVTPDVAPPPSCKDDVAPPPGCKDDVAPPPGCKDGLAPPPGCKDGVAPPPGYKDDITPPPSCKDDVAPPSGCKDGVTPPPGYKDGVTPPPGYKDDVTPPPGYKDGVTPPPGFKEGRKRSHESDAENSSPKKIKINPNHGENYAHDSINDQRTVFLSNLDYNTTENDILPIFESCGEVDNVRLATNYKGRSKGFGYMLFKSQLAASKALQLDRTPVNKRPIFVSVCNPNKHGHQFKYSTTIEKDKLFIRGLPLSMNQDEVSKFFEQYSPIRTIFLVTHRNGFSKGTCYISYNSEEAAETVRKATDGFEILDHKLSVLISDPSKKSKSETEGTTNTQPSISVTSNMRPKLAFMPRAVMRKSTSNQASSSNSSDKKETELNGSSPKKTNMNGSSSSDETKKSNEDFRKMFLK